MQHFYTISQKEADSLINAGKAVFEEMTCYVPFTTSLFRYQLSDDDFLYTTLPFSNFGEVPEPIPERSPQEIACQVIPWFFLYPFKMDDVPAAALPLEPSLLMTNKQGFHFLSSPFTKDDDVVKANAMGYEQVATAFSAVPSAQSTATLSRLHNVVANTWFYSADPGEIGPLINSGNFVEDVDARMPVLVADPNCVPLYRFFTPATGAHRYSTDVYDVEIAQVRIEEEGPLPTLEVFERIECNILGQPRIGTTPLYILFNQNLNDWLLTTSEDERQTAAVNDGYATIGILGEVYTKPMPLTTPLYRLRIL